MREGLPTKEELEALYLNKGREALVWYAWRSALRVLLTLGRLPFDKVWEKRMPEHVFNVCRVSLVLANMSKSDFYANAVVRAANFAANNAKVDYDYDAAYDAASTAARASAAIIYIVFSNTEMSLNSLSPHDSNQALFCSNICLNNRFFARFISSAN